MKLGALDISTVKLGTNQVQAVYQGGNLVWQNAPVATAATGVGQTSFTANWNAYTGAVVYLLDVSESSDFSTFVYEDQQVNAPSTSYVVIGLNPNTTYYYRVRASTEALTDPDAQAFFDRVTAAEGSLSATEQDAVNTLVVQMKADGIWTKMKAIYPMVGASAAACAQNLKSSSFTGSFSSGGTFTSNGYTTNNVSYMDTNLLPSTALTLNSSHLSFYSRTLSNGTEVEIGNDSAAGGSLIEIRTSGTTYYRINSGGTYISSIDSDSRAFYIANRTASNVINGWRNSTKVATGTVSSSGLPTNNIFLGAWNDNNIPKYYTTKECAFASIGDGLTDDEAGYLYNAVQAFNTTLSREI